MQSSRVVVAWHMKQKKKETHSQLTTQGVGIVASLLTEIHTIKMVGKKYSLCKAYVEP